MELDIRILTIGQYGNILLWLKFTRMKKERKQEKEIKWEDYRNRELWEKNIASSNKGEKETYLIKVTKCY